MWTFVAPPPDRGLEPGGAPTFSVVIAAHNAVETIAEAVASALHQTALPREVIIVDDGSTDGTLSALDGYRGHVTVIRQENAGAAAAMNAGVRRATGEFVAMLDADDAYEPERLESLAELGAARPDLDLLATDVAFVMDGKVTGRFSTSTSFSIDDQRTAIFDRCFLAAPALRRHRVLDIGGYDESFRIAYDWDCYLRLILAGGRAGLVDAPRYRYRVTSGSLTGNRVAALGERVVLLEKARLAPGLTPADREALERAIGVNVRRSLLYRADDALMASDPHARMIALSVAVGSGFAVRTRVKALLVTAVPRWARGRMTLSGEWVDRPPTTPSHPR